MPQYVDRYQEFSFNGEVKPIPGISLPVSPTDKQVVYKLGRTRFDRLSQDYYQNPYHGWLIMLANPQFGGLEFDIPDGEIIRIPFPFQDAVNRYINAVKTHISLYGE